MKVRSVFRAWLPLLYAALICSSIQAAWAQSLGSAQPELIVVNVTLNEQKKGDLFVLRAADGNFLVRQEDLRALGLSDDSTSRPVAIDGTNYVSLGSIQGLSFAFSPQQLALRLMADPRLLPRTSIGAGGRSLKAVSLRQDSGFLNYAFTRAVGDSGAYNTLAAEGGLRAGDFMLLSQATSRSSGRSTRTVRLMTSAVRDDVGALQRLTMGDFFTTPGEVGSPVNMGGLQFAKHYGLDPSQKSHPLGLVQGQVALPSEVDIIVNGQRVRTERIQPGEFEVRDLSGYAGAQTVQLVIRDAFGRSQQLNYALYFAEEPLRKGLHDYSYTVGALRRDFGLASNQYGGGALTAFHKYGFTDSVTLGWRTEGRRGLINAGPLGTIVLGNVGVANFAVAGSNASGRQGWAGQLRYAYNMAGLAVGAAARYDSVGYVTLRDYKTIDNRKWEGSAFASRYWAGFGMVSLSHSQLTVHPASSLPVIPGFVRSLLTPRRASSLAYHAGLPWGQSTLSVNLSRVRDERGPRNEISVGLRITLDPRRSVTTTTRRSDRSRYDAMGLTQTIPAGEGWGYDVVADRQREEGTQDRQVRARAQVNTSLAVLRADYVQARSPGVRTDHSLSVSGGLAWVGGRAYLGRPVDDSFGVVKVGELPDIPVLVNGLPAGTTDRDGLLFVPSLASFYENQVSIDARAVPIEYAVGHVTRKVTFPMRSGAMIDFAARRMQAVTGFLLSDAPSSPALELVEVSVGTGPNAIHTTTGQKGEIYLENLPAGRHDGYAVVEGGRCDFVITVPTTPELFVEIGDVTCQRRSGPSPKR